MQFHTGSETENEIRTVISAPTAKPELLQFLMECKLGIIIDVKHTVQKLVLKMSRIHTGEFQLGRSNKKPIIIRNAFFP